MNASENDSSKRMIPCSFCNKEISSSEIGEHLMLCGNKTDQCPNCKKYIRRAIFAYHYENKCTNPEELDANENTSTEPIKDNTTRRPETSPSSLTTANVNRLDGKTISIIPIDISGISEQRNTVTGRTGSDFSESNKKLVSCPHCHCQCELGEREVHEANCLKNRAKTKKKPVPYVNATTENNPIAGQPNRVEHAANNETIPCEICQEPIEWQNFDAHSKACIQREAERTKSQQLIIAENGNGSLRCRYCYTPRPPEDIEFHERLCQRNNRQINDPSYRRVYTLPAVFGSSRQPNE